MQKVTTLYPNHLRAGGLVHRIFDLALDNQTLFRLGRVDKLNPDSDAGKQHEGGEALDQLVVAGGDTA